MPEKNSAYDQLPKEDNPFYQYFLLYPLPILILNHKSFKIIDANQSAVQFFDMSFSELKKKSILQLPQEEAQETWREQIELYKSKNQFSLHLPLLKENQPALYEVKFLNVTIGKTHFCHVTINTENTDQLLYEEKLKRENRDLTEQVRKMVDINRKIINSYENVKKQYQELLDFQEDNVKAERHRTIGEMIEVLQDKINRPLNRILDDVQKVHDAEKKLDPTVVKRLKLIEESAENVLRVISRVAEVRDIKKMRYIELGNM